MAGVSSLAARMGGSVTEIEVVMRNCFQLLRVAVVELALTAWSINDVTLLMLMSYSTDKQCLHQYCHQKQKSSQSGVHGPQVLSKYPELAFHPLSHI